MRLVILPTQENTIKSPWTEAPDQALFKALYGCSICVGELIDINCADLALDSREMRVVPLGRPALISIQSWLEQRAMGIAATDTNALFLGVRGERISAPVVRKALKAQALLQGITSNVYSHRLRHSFASHLLRASGDLRAVQELVGHASIAPTQMYAHLNFQHLAKVYDQAHPRARAHMQKK